MSNFTFSPYFNILTDRTHALIKKLPNFPFILKLQESRSHVVSSGCTGIGAEYVLW